MNNMHQTATRYFILATARSSFHLNLREAVYIQTMRPVLCKQKEFVYALKLFQIPSAFLFGLLMCFLSYFAFRNAKCYCGGHYQASAFVVSP